MEKQFKNYKTFFDYNIDDNDNSEFITVYHYVKGKDFSRVKRNIAAIRYIKGEEVSLEDKKIINAYLDGSINNIQNKKYEHCLLCTDGFERDVLKNFSERYKNWEICFPTNPYTPGGLMMYLKDRKKSHIENIGKLSEYSFYEITCILKDLYTKLKNVIGDGKIVGVNVLFNQISKTQKCIHGHIEPMIRDINTMNVGSEIKKVKPKDKMATLLNSFISKTNGIYFNEQGLRIDLDKVCIEKAKKITEQYRGNICKLRKYVDELKKIDKKKLSINQNELIKHFNPAPVEYVYITYYRDRMFLSIVPEVFLEIADISKIKDENDEKLMYGFRINNYGDSLEEKIMIQRPPIIRPCLKVSTTDEIEKNIKYIKNKIKNGLEKDIEKDRSFGEER